MPCRQLRFLVVEDHEFQRRMLVQLLTSMGAEAVHEAEDGQAALQIVRDRSRPVDIVITDLSMPNMDGIEFVRHLAGSGSGASLILASALEPSLLASVATMAQAYQVRLLGVIGKPPSAVKITPLVEVHRLMQGERPAAQISFSMDEIAEAWSRGEFELRFEPRVALASRAVHGMHATARWRHPERGLLQPHEYLPSLEARGLQEEYEWLVLDKAVAQCASWWAAGLPLQVSLPLGLASLGDPDTAARIRRTAENQGVLPRNLVLGIAESRLDPRQPRLLENFARLRLFGFGLAIEDFGSGGMDSERLAAVAFTEIRLGRSFVEGSNRDESVRASLGIALDLAEKLRLDAVAEGIASETDWNLLQDWGCRFGQGPLIAPAMTAAEVPQWLERWPGGFAE